MQAFLVRSKKDLDKLSLFLETVVGDKDSVSVQDVHSILRKKASQLAKNAINKHPDDFEAAEEYLVKALRTDLGEHYGLHFTASVVPTDSLFTINLNLGSMSFQSTKIASMANVTDS